MKAIKGIKTELILFITITFVVLTSYKIDIRINEIISKTLEYSQTVYLKDFFKNITELGNSAWYFILSIFFIIILLLNKKFKFLYIKDINKKINFFISTIIYISAAGLLTQILKHLIGRPRPNYTNYENLFNFNFFTFESSFHSYPSGHSSTIFMVCFIICSVLPFLKYYLFFLAGLVALSRVVVGAHFFTDIVAGALLSLIVFKVLNYIFNKKYSKFVFTITVFDKYSYLYYSIFFLFSLCLFLSIGSSLDIFVSGLFYYGDSQFYLQKYDYLSLFFRKFFLSSVIVYILLIPIFSRHLIISKLFFGYKFNIKEIFLIWLSQILIVLLFINLILKNFWGRVRPGDIIQYGGIDVFTPWYMINNACNSNCSFVSGDASVGFSLIVIYLITKKLFFLYLSLLSGFALGFIRILEGGHFLSDIVFAGFFVFVLNIVLYKLYGRLYEQ